MHLHAQMRVTFYGFGANKPGSFGQHKKTPSPSCPPPNAEVVAFCPPPFPSCSLLGPQTKTKKNYRLPATETQLMGAEGLQQRAFAVQGLQPVSHLKLLGLSLGKNKTGHGAKWAVQIFRMGEPTTKCRAFRFLLKTASTLGCQRKNALNWQGFPDLKEARVGTL